MSTQQGSARDWDAWARTFESIDGPDDFAALFAAGGQFCDPVTPWTTDLHKVARDTDAIFPDWNQRVDRIRGGEDWAVFEWTATATARSPPGGTTSTPTNPPSRSRPAWSGRSKAADRTLTRGSPFPPGYCACAARSCCSSIVFPAGSLIQICTVPAPCTARS
jgi:hypothetical protein